MAMYLVVVFFVAGLNGPAHFEEKWYPQLIEEGGLVTCTFHAHNTLQYLSTASEALNGEMYEVACVEASDAEDLAKVIKEHWTFEGVPTINRSQES